MLANHQQLPDLGASRAVPPRVLSYEGVTAAEGLVCQIKGASPGPGEREEEEEEETAPTQPPLPRAGME